MAGLANFNAPTQIVVSGAQEMIPVQDAWQAGAKRYIPLKVSEHFTSIHGARQKCV